MHSAADFRSPDCISAGLRAKVGALRGAGLLRAGAENVNESGAVRVVGFAPERRRRG